MKTVAIIGGGVSGLSTALHLKDRSSEIPGGLRLVVLEGGSVPGGNIRTDKTDGYTVEWGPNGYLDNVPTTPALIRRLGLEDRVQKATENATKRYLFRNGRLHELPMGPASFLTCPVLSLKGRLRVLLEPFGRKRPSRTDETVFSFASRRIGSEAASILVDAMVSGIFAGNVHELSLQSAFPKMDAMESKHGSLTKAMIAKLKAKKRAKARVKEMLARGEEVEELTQAGGPAGPGGTLTSFDGGLSVLVNGLSRELGEIVHTEKRVSRLLYQPSASEGRFDLRTDCAEFARADAVVVATPSPLAAELFMTLDEKLGEIVSEIPTASLAVVALGFEEESLGGAPDGFGFLIPRGEGARILGCLWDSSIFPGRAPRGRVLMRCMIGGSHDTEAAALDDETLLSIVAHDLETTMGLTAKPTLTRIYRHPLGIAQYNVGHQEKLNRIHGQLSEYPGLWVAGSSYYGIAMNACIQKAGEQAEEILSFLRD